jgi:predicted mannosyl-3-phosphoglycerate phosphatase (HAD superfamily)
MDQRSRAIATLNITERGLSVIAASQTWLVGNAADGEGAAAARCARIV